MADLVPAPRRVRTRSAGPVAAALTAGALCSSCLFPPEAPPPEPGFTVVNDERTGTFHLPVWYGGHPTDDGGWLVAEKSGTVYLVTPGTQGTNGDTAGNPVRTVFADIPAFHEGLDGFLTLAFHPDFPANRKYYVAYNAAAGRLVVEERRADSSLRADAGVSREILAVENEVLGHNGGDLRFGPDGYLYIALGDGSTIAEFLTDSQDLRSPHGKLLRLDVDREEDGKPYGIPADNPFANHPDSAVLPEIWAYGLRSPWRMSFAPDGRLFLVDVGHGRQDEVNLIVKGGNYGWRTLEGRECFNDDDPLSPLDDCDRSGTIPPIHVIEHPTPFGVCLVGGAVYRGDPSSRYHGAYLFGDYKNRTIHALFEEEDGSWRAETLGEAPDFLSSFGEDADGTLYLVGHHAGRIHRMNPGGSGLAGASGP